MHRIHYHGKLHIFTTALNIITVFMIKEVANTTNPVSPTLPACRAFSSKHSRSDAFPTLFGALFSCSHVISIWECSDPNPHTFILHPF